MSSLRGCLSAECSFLTFTVEREDPKSRARSLLRTVLSLTLAPALRPSVEELRLVDSTSSLDLLRGPLSSWSGFVSWI